MVVLLFSGSLGRGCAPGLDLDKHLSSINKSYRFSIARWELTAIRQEIGGAIFGRRGKPSDGASRVTDYFTTAERIKGLESEIAAIKADKKPGDLASLETDLDRLQRQNQSINDYVERVIETQIREALSQQGIFNPLLKLKVGFPPVNFRLEKPPYFLVVSLRDRIETIRKVNLKQEIGLEEMEGIEYRVDELGVSSLVVELGGLSTFPSLISDRGDLRFILDAITEEWLHLYLTFKPLGFRYLLDVLGISRNYEIVTINETLASMVSKEIGALVYARYYAQDEKNGAESEAKETGFDFNREMREIRRAVDTYLVQGKIEQAEEFMEQKRQFLVSKGYHIRKLNQAYFAFYGTYADRPTSISLIGVELRKLRSQSTSLKDFLETVAAMKSRQDLADAVKEVSGETS